MSKIYLRPPIVSVMGHVDHGKTSILDYIRRSNVTSKEHGGITQHIGAYQAEFNGKKITFIDTPGHEAFSQMRSRGGQVSDIVLLVVAADAGVQAQTKEAIFHAKASGGQIIVVLNKIDLPNSDLQKAKQQLASENILVEDWGGDIPVCEVSAKTGAGIDNLLNTILLLNELHETSSDIEGELEAVIIEGKVDKQKGVLVSAIVKNGTLKVGDEVYASGYGARIKSLTDYLGKNLKEVLPGDAVEILGFKNLPSVGDIIVSQGSELMELSSSSDKVEIIGKETKKTLNLILKSDTFGTLEAIKASLANLVTSNVNADYSIKFLISQTGEITDSDVLLADSTKGIIVGFNLKPSNSVIDLADTKGVMLKTYNTIYSLIEDLEKILEGKAFLDEQKIKGRAEVVKIFKLPSGDLILGSKVIAGVIKDTSRIAIYEKNPAELTPEDKPIYNGEVKKLKRGKDEVKVVGKDNDCGVLLKPDFPEARVGLFIEVR
jgi:translation initiation factor IF-2